MTISGPGQASARDISVAERMSRQPITVTTNESCLWVLRIMSAAEVHHVPVLEEGRLVGIVTELDIYRRSPAKLVAGSETSRHTSLLEKVSVGGVMTYGPVTIAADAPVADAVALMLERKVGSLPVVDREGALVGIFTHEDGLRVLAALDPQMDGNSSGSGA